MRAWFRAGVAAIVMAGGLAIAAPPPADDDDDDNAPPAVTPHPPVPDTYVPEAPGPLPKPPGPLAPGPLPQGARPPGPLPTAPAAVAAPVASAPPVVAPLPPPVADTTPVSAETVGLAGEADRLRDSFTQHDLSLTTLHSERNKQATDYYGLTSDIGRKLAIGVPPGDAALSDELARARGALDRLRTNTAQMQTVSDQLTDDATTALHLAGAVETKLGTPGIGANERAALTQVEGKVSAAQAAIDQRLRETLAAIGRGQRSLTVEAQNLAQLERGIASGALEPASEAAPRPIAAASVEPPPGKPAKPGAKTPPNPQPPDPRPHSLIVIPKDSTASAYQHQLYAAVAEALQHAPTADFTVRATTPARGSLANQTLEATALQHRAADVVRSLTTFGLPRARIAVTQASDAAISEPQIEVLVDPSGHAAP